ncbi:hypothetical protein AFFFEF_00602 [Methylorubrum extorquens]
MRPNVGLLLCGRHRTGQDHRHRQLEYDLVMRQGARVAHMGFEDTRRDVRLLSIHVSDRLDMEPRSDDAMRAVRREIFGAGNV